MLMAIRQHPFLTGLAATSWFIALAAILFLHGNSTEPVDSFASCAEAGYPVTDSNPPVCRHGMYYVTGPVRSVGEPASAVQSEPFDLLVLADSGTDTPRQQVVVRSQDAWISWWAKVHAGLILPPLIQVDFASHDVVIIIGGPKETTGYDYKVTAVSAGKRTAVIDTLESTPTISCPVISKRTNRYNIVRTIKLPDPVVFRNTKDNRHCY